MVFLKILFVVLLLVPIAALMIYYINKLAVEFNDAKKVSKKKDSVSDASTSAGSRSRSNIRSKEDEPKQERHRRNDRSKEDEPKQERHTRTSRSKEYEPKQENIKTSSKRKRRKERKMKKEDREQ